MNHIDWLGYFNREKETALEAGDRLVHLLRPRRVASVLDAAAGTGVRAVALARAGFTVVACEVDEMLFARAGTALSDAEDISIPLYRLGLRGVDAVAEGPFDAVLALDDALTRRPQEAHARILGTLGEQIVPSGYLVLGLRDWDAQLRTQEYFVPRQLTRMNGTRLLMFEVWEYNIDGTATATTFYLHAQNDEWRVRTRKTTYYPARGKEIQTVIEATEFRLIELLDHPDEQWWILQKSK